MLKASEQGHNFPKHWSTKFAIIFRHANVLQKKKEKTGHRARNRKFSARFQEFSKLNKKQKKGHRAGNQS